MCKTNQLDLVNAVVWIPDSKTPTGIGEVPLTEVALAAFEVQMRIAGEGPFLFPSDKNRKGHHTTFKTAWAARCVWPTFLTSASTICAQRMRRG